MLSCKQASQLVSQSLERRLTYRERFGLSLHLMMCDACKLFSRQLRLLRQAMQRIGRNVEQDTQIVLSGEARKRIANKLESSH
ncbi:MAG TPA: zf-HC2 domain-containing protein [Methylophilaceae bacterium]|nr:zf-HC2 domain-containing protein [Methylophilaceae bacterium]